MKLSAGLLVFICMLASTVANESDWMSTPNLAVHADIKVRWRWLV